MRSPILKDFPESFETERLLIRSPLPGDGPEMHAVVNESLDELLPWMDWPKQHKSVEDSEERIRRHRVSFLGRTDLARRIRGFYRQRKSTPHLVELHKDAAGWIGGVHSSRRGTNSRVEAYH